MVASKGECGRRGRKKAAPVNRIGAVSPAARSSPRMTPVRIPGSASFNTMRRMVCQRVAPSEILTVRNACGTERNDSSAVLMMTGRVMIESVSEAARMDVPKFRKRTKRPQTKQSIHDRWNPRQIDDRDPDRARQRRVGGIFGEIDCCSNPKRNREDGCADGEIDRADDGRQNSAGAHSVTRKACKKFKGDRRQALKENVDHHSNNGDHSRSAIRVMAVKPMRCATWRLMGSARFTTRSSRRVSLSGKQRRKQQCSRPVR